MQYSHKNIKLNVSTINPNWVENMGETVLTLKTDFIAELLENSCTFGEFFIDFEAYEIVEEQCDGDKDKLPDYFRTLDSTFETRNADAIIAVYEYCLDNPETNYEFDVETENVSWVIHDILHAIHDAAGCTIYVESDIESRRIIKSLEITKEEFPNEMPDAYFLEQLEDAFYARFKTRIDLDDFKYSEEYEEEEEY